MASRKRPEPTPARSIEELEAVAKKMRELGVTEYEEAGHHVRGLVGEAPSPKGGRFVKLSLARSQGFNVVQPGRARAEHDHGLEA
jgi:hypothetical protein